jgi:hypothetical protein
MSMQDSKTSLPVAALVLGLPLLAVAAGRPAARPAAPAAVEPRPGGVPAASPLSSSLEPCADLARSINGRGYEVRYLVATLPDPGDSLYARLFDLHTGAIRRAMERLEYVEDGSCLPWPHGGDAAEKGADGRPLYRVEPGVLLFRNDGRGRGKASLLRGGAAAADRALTVVFLVGESPPWGVHAEALGRALDYACLGLGAWPAAEAPALLAPTFSASTASLAVALRDWYQGGEQGPRRRRCVAGGLEVVSGTATGTGVRRTLDDVLPRELEWSYLSLATPNDELESCMLRRFLPELLGIDGGEAAGGSGRASVALLVESSLYGQDFGADLLVLPFPMHISNLRNEYEAQKAQLGGAASGSGGAETQRRFLALQAGESTQARDAGRAFDVVGTTRSQELELAHILAVIARDRIQAVGIIATNIRDTLFLADALRRYAPDVRLFTFEADLLLAHPDYGAATRGMIVASSNPLVDPDPVVSRNGGSAGGASMLQFANDTSQGTYEAMRWLAGSPAGGEETSRATGQRTDQAPRREVWFSVVGNARLTPVERLVLAPGSDGACRVATGNGSHGYTAGRPPRGWSFVLSLLTGLILAVLVHLATALARGVAAAGGLLSPQLLWFRNPALEPLPRGAQRVRHALLAMIPLTMALPYLVLSGPVFFTRSHPRLPAVAAAGLVALAAAVAVLLWGLVRRTRRDLAGDAAPLKTLQKVAIVAPLAFAVVLLAVVAVVAGVAWSYLRRKTDHLVLDLDRYIAFGSGVSPLLPCLLMLAVLMGWLILTLWRYRTLEILPQPEHIAGGGLPRRLRRGLRALRGAVDPAGFLTRRILTPGQAVAWSALVLAPVLYLSFYYQGRVGRLLHGVDGGKFDVLASWLFAGVLVCATASALALWQGWVGLRATLLALAELRFSPAEPAASADGPRWLEPIRDVDKSAAGAGALLLERRDAAYERLVAELRRGGDPPPSPGLAPERLAPAAEGAGPPELARLWVAVAAWAAERGRGAVPAVEGEGRLLEAARDFFAWQTALISRESTALLLKLLSFMTFGLLGLWVSVAVYPFEPERVLRFIVGGLIAAGVVVTLAFVVQVEKQPLLSHLHGTRANQVNWHRAFLQRLALYVGLPLLSLLTGQFPEVQRLLQQALEPAFKVLL